MINHVRAVRPASELTAARYLLPDSRYLVRPVRSVEMAILRKSGCGLVLLTLIAMFAISEAIITAPLNSNTNVRCCGTSPGNCVDTGACSIGRRLRPRRAAAALKHFNVTGKLVNLPAPAKVSLLEAAPDLPECTTSSYTLESGI